MIAINAEGGLNSLLVSFINHLNTSLADKECFRRHVDVIEPSVSVSIILFGQCV